MNQIILPVIITSAVASVVIFLTENMPSSRIVRFLCALCICLSILIPLKILLPEFETFSESLLHPEETEKGAFDSDFSEILRHELEKTASDVLLYRFDVKTEVTATLDTSDMTNIRIISLAVRFENQNFLKKAECIAALKAEFLCEVTEIK